MASAHQYPLKVAAGVPGDDLLQLSGAVWLGNSGGGAFNEDGELIGVCSWIDEGYPGVAFFVHADHVRDLMTRAGIGP